MKDEEFDPRDSTEPSASDAESIVVPSPAARDVEGSGPVSEPAGGAGGGAEVVAADPAPTGEGPRLPGAAGVTMPWTSLDRWACIVIVIVSLVVVGLHVRAYPTLSPIDELQHVDYMIRAGEFDIPRRNERVGQEAMAEAACRSVDAPGYVSPTCGLPRYSPESFQERGFNTAASQFPPYYVVTGLGARALTALTPIGSKVTAGRMIGALWLAAALCVIWYLMAQFGVRRDRRAVVVGLLLGTPLVIFHAGATVNADVSLMLCGALAMLATVKFDAGRLRWWWLPLIYVAVFFVEATNILAVAACALYLIARRGLDRSLDWRSRVAPLAVIPGLAILRLYVASAVRDLLFPAVRVRAPAQRMNAAPMFRDHRSTGVSIGKIVDQLDATFTPIRNAYVSPPLVKASTYALTQLVDWLFIALLVAVGVLMVSEVAPRWWARATVVALLAAGPFYTFYFAYFSDADFPAPARFGLPLVPLLAVVAATGLRHRTAVVAGGVLACLGLANVVILLAVA